MIQSEKYKQARLILFRWRRVLNVCVNFGQDTIETKNVMLLALRVMRQERIKYQSNIQRGARLVTEAK